MTLFPHLPHTQGIIEISLKPPKTPYIIQKKRISPQRTQKHTPTLQKKKLSRFYPLDSFFVITLLIGVLSVILP